MWLVISCFCCLTDEPLFFMLSLLASKNLDCVESWSGFAHYEGLLLQSNEVQSGIFMWGFILKIHQELWCCFGAFPVCSAWCKLMISQRASKLTQLSDWRFQHYVMNCILLYTFVCQKKKKGDESVKNDHFSFTHSVTTWAIKENR